MHVVLCADWEPEQPRKTKAVCSAPSSLNPGSLGASTGEPLASQEAVISEALSNLPEAAGEHIIEQAVRDSPAVAARLQQHVQGLFHGNTHESTDGKERAWKQYCLHMFGKVVPPLDEMPWPPSESQWTDFVVHVRSIVSSHLRMQNVVAHVCDVGSRYFGRRAAAQQSGRLGSLDPRCIYKQAHGRIVGLLFREYGSDLRQVEGITMQEALNAHKFVDANSVKGLLMGAAFHVGTTHGGRRPRTLTAIRVKDQLFAISR